jgi:short-subunit dehydrogenase
MTAKYTGEAFRARFGPWAVVAGGSDGIGAAFGEALARRGLDVVLIGRSEAKLAHQVARIGALHPVEVRSLVADLTAPDVGVRVAEATADLDVGLFIYNAGSGREMGSFLDHPVENWLRQVHLACCGPLLLSHHFGGRLRARGRGGIVLMSSLASRHRFHHAVEVEAARLLPRRELAEALQPLPT